MQAQQKGFGVIGIVIIILVVGVIGFVGWRLVATRRPADTANDLPLQSTQKSDTQSKPSNAANSVSLVELGVKLNNVPEAIHDLQYKILPPTSGQSYQAAYFSTLSLMSAAKTTDVLKCPIGIINRYPGTYNSDTDQGPFVYVKQFSGYWLAYVHIGSTCSEDQAVVALQTNQIGIFKTLAIDADNFQKID